MAGRRKRVLVVEGGAMRGAYAAGVLIDLFHRGKLDFDAVWATSSGAASAAYGIAGQGEGIGIWRDHLHGTRLVSRWRFLTGRSALDLEYLVGEVFQRRVPLNVDRLAAARTALWVPVTDVETAAVEYFDLRRGDPFPVLRAAMSLPGAALEGVDIGGRKFVDGGVLDQLPVEAALAAEPDELVVVMTRPIGYAASPLGRTGMWLATRRFPGLREALRQRHVRYSAAVEALERAAQSIPVTVIRPGEPLPVSRWTTRRSRILAAIDRGAADAARAVS